VEKFRKTIRNIVEGADELAGALIEIIPAIIIIALFIFFLRGCIF